MRRLVAGLAVAAAACGGGGGGGGGRIDISGRTPAEASVTIARAVCSKSAACGRVAIMCSTGSTGTPQCAATIEPVSYDRCYADAQADLAQVLACRTLTSTEEDAIEDCFNATVAAPCPTQAEADARARQPEAGTDTPPPRPPICTQVDEIFSGSCS